MLGARFLALMAVWQINSSQSPAVGPSALTIEQSFGGIAPGCKQPLNKNLSHEADNNGQAASFVYTRNMMDSKCLYN